MAEFLTPSEVFEIKSKVPLTGFTTSPTTPFPSPLKKPPTPPFLVSLIGYVTTPATPDPIAFPNPMTPLPAPSKKFLGASLTFSSSLLSIYPLSAERTNNPFESDPKMLDADPNVPWTVFLNRLPVP